MYLHLGGSCSASAGASPARAMKTNMGVAVSATHSTTEGGALGCCLSAMFPLSMSVFSSLSLGVVQYHTCTCTVVTVFNPWDVSVVDWYLIPGSSRKQLYAIRRKQCQTLGS